MAAAPGSVTYPIESVDNALRLIRLLDERREVGVTEAARELRVAPSTAHRLLAMLVFRGFAIRNARRAYEPTSPTAEVASSGEAGLETALAPLLAQLADRLEETVHFVVVHGTAAHFVAAAECRSVDRLASRAGMTMPAHSTAVGKVVLSSLASSELDAIYPRGLPDVYGPVPSSLDALKKQLASVRKAGYAVCMEENERDIVAVAVAARDSSGRVRGAFGVGMVRARCPNGRIPRVARELMAAAADARRLIDPPSGEQNVAVAD